MECPGEIAPIYDVECGMVTVPEDHTNPDGPTIRLAFAIVHSVSPNPASVPLLFIDGGPGSRTLDGLSRWWLELIGPLLTQRDVIFFDQRGAGYSSPSLVCPEIEIEASSDLVKILSHIALFLSCRDRLIATGVDLNTYNSVQTAADIEFLRSALGYESWHLYGVSYGARIALTVMRDHPQGIASVTLDAITPIDANLFVEDAPKGYAAIKRMLQACLDDFVCHNVYPDLEQVYGKVVAELAATPVFLEIVHPKTGERKTEMLDGKALNGLILGSLLMPELSGLPGLIYALWQGDYRPLVIAMQDSWQAETEDDQNVDATKLLPPLGVQVAMLCNDEAPYVSPEAVAKMLATYPPELHYLADFDQRMYALCQAWGIGPRLASENQAIFSDIPALVLAGEYDHAQSPESARRAAQNLSNSYVVCFPGAGHAVLYSATPCALQLMADFMVTPTSLPDTSCVDELTSSWFYMTIATTRPIARVAAILCGLAGLMILIVTGVRFTRLAKSGQVLWYLILRQVDWRGWLVSAGVIVALYILMPVIDLTYFYERSLTQTIVIVLPLAAAIQVVTQISLESTILEVPLACPRPFEWLFAERLLLALVGQIFVGVLMTAAAVWFLGEQYSLAALWGWLASLLFLSGLAANFCIRSRQPTMGVLIALLVWLVFGIASSNIADGLIPAIPLTTSHVPWPRPLGWLQPFLWLVHPFLRPDLVTPGDFLLNRLIIVGLGLALLARGMRYLGDNEFILLGVRTNQRTLKKRGDVCCP